MKNSKTKYTEELEDMLRVELGRNLVQARKQVSTWNIVSGIGVILLCYTYFFLGDNSQVAQYSLLVLAATIALGFFVKATVLLQVIEGMEDSIPAGVATSYELKQHEGGYSMHLLEPDFTSHVKKHDVEIPTTYIAAVKAAVSSARDRVPEEQVERLDIFLGRLNG